MSTQTSHSPKKRRTVYQIRRKQLNYRLLDNDGDVAEQNKEWLAGLKEFVNAKRDSPVKATLAKDFKETTNLYKEHEATFLLNVLPFITASEYTATEKDRQVIEEQEKTPSPEKDRQVIEEQEVIYQAADQSLKRKLNGAMAMMRSFFQDGLATGTDQIYKAYLHAQDLPIILVGAASHSSTGFEAPKSDRIYGYRPGKQGRLHWKKGAALPDDLQDRCEPVSAVHHPFFTLEGKPAGGDATDMLNKAKKSSASLVFNHRVLRESAGQSLDGMLEDGKGADKETYVFAATINSDIYRIYVGFANVDPDGSLSYNLQKLHSVAIDDDDALEKGRRWAHNILCWGLWDRINGVNTTREALHESVPDSARRRTS